jgi:hypothetical protein
MSLEETKKHLIELLEDQDSKVIALSGKWGTGKTHLWGEVMQASGDERVRGAIYVSLFGLSAIDQVKRKLIEAIAPGAEAHPGLWDGAKQAFAAALKAAEGFHKSFAAANELSLLLLAPVMLKGKVIVIDDIERKHEKLGIDEIMGFIDEFTQRNKVRFVLVLNSDQLAKREMWDTLREKVIDQEIKLLTTPDEAYDIAETLLTSPYSAAIKRAAVTCGLTNIRIVRKVIKAVNRILQGRTLTDAIVARVVPSIVLFSAIHYKGIHDGPDAQFALSLNTRADWGELFGRDGEEPTEEQKRHGNWRLLMNELGIARCDEFELLVVDFLDSGLFDLSRLAPILDRYTSEADAFEAREAAKKFLFAEVWNHRLSNAELLDLAAPLACAGGLLDPYIASNVATAVAKLPGGDAIAQSIIDGWIAAFRAHGTNRVIEENPFNNPLHSSIVAEFQNVVTDQQDNITLLDAVLHTIEYQGWGPLQEIVFQRATAADFESIIRTLDVATLPRFMRRMIDMRIHKETYEQSFGKATERFVEACGVIANDSSTPRLAELIKFLIGRTSISSEINLPQGGPIDVNQAGHT